MEQRKRFSIGIDLMGNEASPHRLLEAISEVQKELKDLLFCLFVSSEFFQKFSPKSKIDAKWIVSSQVIEMNEEPLQALRKKRDSSLVIGLQSLRDGKIDAFITGGNTGVLITASTLILSPLPHIRRFPLMASLPKKKGSLIVLDVGGIVEPTLLNFVQYAYLGTVYHHLISRKAKTKVGLINIGKEDKKGTKKIKEVFEVLTNIEGPFTFVGNVEGDQLFQKEVDVVLSDGFTGNIFLKSLEGLSSFMIEKLDERIKETTISHRALSCFDGWKHYFGPTSYPGAIVLGAKELVMKCHGKMEKESFVRTIRESFFLLTRNFSYSMQKKFEKMGFLDSLVGPEKVRIPRGKIFSMMEKKCVKIR